MPPKQQNEASTDDVAELLDGVDKTLDRVKTLYEQYFLGIQKSPPTFMHNDVERKLRDLTQLQLRNTGLRYRLATIQQKFGSYNSYWRRTLRQIENGTYMRNLSKIGREAVRTGAEIPEEILAAMPKRMREQVLRDREQALAVAKRRSKPTTNSNLLPPEPTDDVIAMIKEPTDVRRSLRMQNGAHVLDESDAEIDIDAFFEAVRQGTIPPPLGSANIAKPIAAPAPPPAQKRPASGPERPASGLDRTGPHQAITRPGTAGPHVVPRAPTGGHASIPRASTSDPTPGETVPAPAADPMRSTGAQPAVPRPGTGAQPAIPKQATGGHPVVPKPATGGYPVVPKPATGGHPVVPRPATGGQPAIPRPPGAIPPIPPPLGAIPPIPRPATGENPAVPRVAASQASRPNPIAPGSAAAHGATDVESMAGPFVRDRMPTPVHGVPAIPKRATPPQGVPVHAPPAPSGPTAAAKRPPAPPPQKPPPGMSDADVNALYAKYVKAKEMVGEKIGPGEHSKLLKTINQQAPKIMEQYKAKGVDFSVVVKDNQVIIRAKPKT